MHRYECLAPCRHQSAERPILWQISSLMYPKIQQRQVIMNVLHPGCARPPRWSPPVLWRRLEHGLASVCIFIHSCVPFWIIQVTGELAHLCDSKETIIYTVVKTLCCPPCCSLAGACDLAIRLIFYQCCFLIKKRLVVLVMVFYWMLSMNFLVYVWSIISRGALCMCFKAMDREYCYLCLTFNSQVLILALYIYCLLVYIICFPTYPFLCTFPYLSLPLHIFSFENRPAPFPGQML